MLKQARYIVGIDEVGRGPLAGPVTVAAVALLSKSNIKYQISKTQIKNKKFIILRDSKKLSEEQREKWFEWIKEQGLFYAAASVYPKVIDRINITKAANLAATRAFIRLMTNNKQLTTKNFKIFLDGGLYLKESLVVGHKSLVRTVVRGDEKFNCVKLASIVAKVRRDRLLKRYHKKYPGYGFDKHKGYGTRAHITALKRHGVCKLHRLTFIKNLVKL